MNPWLCIRKLDTSHGYVWKIMKKGGDAKIRQNLLKNEDVPLSPHPHRQ